MEYCNIKLSCNPDSRTDSGIFANVRMMDDSFDHYMSHSPFGMNIYWGNPDMMKYYENIPAPLKGEIMTPKVMGTDILHKTGCVCTCLFAIVSQAFINVLNAAGVSSDEYLLKPIEITNGDGPYFMFFVPSYDFDAFDVEKTSDGSGYSPQGVTLKKAEYSKDLLKCRDVDGLFISDRVLKALNEANIKGFDVDEECQLKVLPYGQPCDHKAGPSITEEGITSTQTPYETDCQTEEDVDDKFDALLTEMFINYFSKASALRRHEVLLSWNFDFPKAILKYVVSQPETDIATAQMIYWRLEPESVRDYEDKDDMPILDIIEQNIGCNFYQDNGFAYDPRDDDGYDAVQCNTEHTPETSYHPELLKARSGKYVEGITDDDGIPKQLRRSYVRLVRSLGLEDFYL